MNNYQIKIQNNSLIWDKFIMNSASPNIFNHSIFLNSYEVEKYFIYNNEEIYGAFSINRNKDSKIILPKDLLYTPIIFKAFLNKPISSISSDKFSTIDTVVNYLSKEANSLEITFDHYTDDLRPFFWYNFNKKKEIFSVSNIKYTSIIDLDKLEKKNFETTHFFKNMSVRTRQSYRYSLNRKNYSFKEYFEINLIKDLIKETFKRQNKNFDFDLDFHLEILNKLYKKSLIKSYTCLEKNKVKSIAVFGINNNLATYINGARLNNTSDDYSQVFLLIQSFIELKKKGVKFIDLEGMNSPKRSFFKNGFGGVLKPYYTVKS